MLLSALRSQRLLAIVRGTDAAAALQTVITLAEEGIGLVEVSLTTPQALNVISQASRQLGTRTMVGAGTVITAQDAAGAADAGAAFVPVGGVDADAAREYLAAGATGVGVGSPLIADAASGGPLSGLRERARQFRQAVGAGERP